MVQQNTNPITYANVGRATLWMRRGGRITVTVQMNCPWLVWSTHTGNSGTTMGWDNNQKLMLDMMTTFDGGRSVIHEVNLKRLWKYERTSDYYSW